MTVSVSPALSVPASLGVIAERAAGGGLEFARLLATVAPPLADSAVGSGVMAAGGVGGGMMGGQADVVQAPPDTEMPVEATLPLVGPPPKAPAANLAVPTALPMEWDTPAAATAAPGLQMIVASHPDMIGVAPAPTSATAPAPAKVAPETVMAPATKAAPVAAAPIGDVADAVDDAETEAAGVPDAGRGGPATVGAQPAEVTPVETRSRTRPRVDDGREDQAATEPPTAHRSIGPGQPPALPIAPAQALPARDAGVEAQSVARPGIRQAVDTPASTRPPAPRETAGIAAAPSVVDVAPAPPSSPEMVVSDTQDPKNAAADLGPDGVALAPASPPPATEAVPAAATVRNQAGGPASVAEWPIAAPGVSAPSRPAAPSQVIAQRDAGTIVAAPPAPGAAVPHAPVPGAPVPDAPVADVRVSAGALVADAVKPAPRVATDRGADRQDRAPASRPTALPEVVAGALELASPAEGSPGMDRQSALPQVSFPQLPAAEPLPASTVSEDRSPAAAPTDVNRANANPQAMRAPPPAAAMVAQVGRATAPEAARTDAPIAAAIAEPQPVRNTPPAAATVPAEDRAAALNPAPVPAPLPAPVPAGAKQAATPVSVPTDAPIADPQPVPNTPPAASAATAPSIAPPPPSQAAERRAAPEPVANAGKRADVRLTGALADAMPVAAALGSVPATASGPATHPVPPSVPIPATAAVSSERVQGPAKAAAAGIAAPRPAAPSVRAATPGDVAREELPPAGAPAAPAQSLPDAKGAVIPNVTAAPTAEGLFAAPPPAPEAARGAPTPVEPPRAVAPRAEPRSVEPPRARAEDTMPPPVAQAAVPGADAAPALATTLAAPADTAAPVPVQGTEGAPAAQRAEPRPVAAPALPPRPEPPAQVAGAVAVLARQGEGSHRLTLRLDPGALGRIEVVIERKGQGPAEVTLTVERPETLLRLVRDQDQLARALDQAGLAPQERTVRFLLAELAPVAEAPKGAETETPRQDAPRPEAPRTEPSKPDAGRPPPGAMPDNGGAALPQRQDSAPDGRGRQQADGGAPRHVQAGPEPQPMPTLPPPRAPRLRGIDITA